MSDEGNCFEYIVDVGTWSVNVSVKPIDIATCFKISIKAIFYTQIIGGLVLIIIALPVSFYDPYNLFGSWMFIAGYFVVTTITHYTVGLVVAMVLVRYKIFQISFTFMVAFILSALETIYQLETMPPEWCNNCYTANNIFLNSAWFLPIGATCFLVRYFIVRSVKKDETEGDNLYVSH